MSLYSEQFEERIKRDDAMFMDACSALAGVVVGEKLFRAFKNDWTRAKNAIDEICKYYHVTICDIPENITDVNEQLEFAFRGAGVMRRAVTLKGAWYKDAVGAMLGYTKDGAVVALIPCKFGGLCYTHPVSGARIRLNKKTANNIEGQAICFYRALPQKRITSAELFGFIARSLTAEDVIVTAVFTLLATLLMLVTPMITRALYAGVQSGGTSTLLIGLGAPLISAIIAKALLDMTKNVAVSRVTIKAGVATQSACMMRLLSMPASFFREFSSGELASRTDGVGTLCGDLAACIMTFGLAPVFSLVLLFQMGNYTSSLLPIAAYTLLAIAGISTVDILWRTKRELMIAPLAAKEEGVVYAFLCGVQKVKLAGAEKRAFSRWADAYQSHASPTYNPPRLLKLTTALNTAAALMGTLGVYYTAISANVLLPDYIAFNTAFGVLIGVFASLTGMAAPMVRIRSALAMLQPLLSAVPEASEKRKPVAKLDGHIELNHVMFRYRENMAPVIDDLSLEIESGEYVAIVGSTGCGKSTLVRLLLGFEKPQRGSIYYDGQDIEDIDQRSLRRHIGVVLQNGTLFRGDIFSNIVVSAPWLTLDDAWEAAEIAGLARDIRNMPLGMNTIIMEGGAGISGGQKQRLMIARAIAGKPRILIFDEATSALDNATQNKITSALKTLKCTRIVIAHRLSTIRQCDRVHVLANGTIVESGTYQELVDKNGFFAELVARQRLDNKHDFGNTTLC